jgi:hypothetical protein
VAESSPPESNTTALLLLSVDMVTACLEWFGCDGYGVKTRA